MRAVTIILLSDRTPQQYLLTNLYESSNNFHTASIVVQDNYDPITHSSRVRTGKFASIQSTQAGLTRPCLVCEIFESVVPVRVFKEKSLLQIVDHPNTLSLFSAGYVEWWSMGVYSPVSG